MAVFRLNRIKSSYRCLALKGHRHQHRAAPMHEKDMSVVKALKGRKFSLLITAVTSPPPAFAPVGL